MKKQRVTMWVAPEFRKAVKKASLDHGQDVISFTSNIACDFDDIVKKKSKRKDDFGFF